MRPAAAIILFGDADPLRNTSTPGDNSGWQFQGQFGGFLGTPIAPYYFLTAQHIGGSVGDTIVYHGQSFTTVAYDDDLTSDTPAAQISDLRLWRVDTPFPTYAPLLQAGNETGRELRVYGRGAQRGDPLVFNGALKGWNWGGANYVQRWGKNFVSGLTDDPLRTYLVAAFDRGAGPNEAHLSNGDSGGGVFVLDEGLWKLAAINYAVDDLYDQSGAPFVAAVFDARGFYQRNGDGSLTLIQDPKADVPTSFYSTRVLPRLAWIKSKMGVEDLPALPPESYPAWLRGYYAPAQIADAATAGAGADPDGDGVSNLLEFAFNLDPTYPEPAVLAPAAGVRGLPSIRVEGSGGERRLTIEYIRRSAASDPGVTYAAQFTGNLVSGAWQTAAAETATPINARWDRVKVTDPGSTGARFARVQVTVTAPPRGAQSKSDRPPGAPRTSLGPR